MLSKTFVYLINSILKQSLNKHTQIQHIYKYKLTQILIYEIQFTWINILRYDGYKLKTGRRSLACIIALNYFLSATETAIYSSMRYGNMS